MSLMGNWVQDAYETTFFSSQNEFANSIKSDEEPLYSEILTKNQLAVQLQNYLVSLTEKSSHVLGVVHWIDRIEGPITLGSSSITNLTRHVAAIPGLSHCDPAHAMRTPRQSPAHATMVRIRAAALADGHIDRAGSRAFGRARRVICATPNGLRGRHRRAQQQHKDNQNQPTWQHTDHLATSVSSSSASRYPASATCRAAMGFTVAT